MIFINPKTDFAFKKIFGSEQSKAILMSFLNGILYDGISTIQDLTILNPYQAPKIWGIKDTYLDIKAQLTSGDWVIIEMQVLNVEGFEKRVLYNATKAYSIQLGKGESYSSLNPVIALTITDFEMFEEVEAAVSRFVLKEKETLIDYPITDLELVFLELPKFKKQLEGLESLKDKWIYFLQHAKDLSVVPPTMGEVAEIQQAFEMANQAMMSREELDEMERKWIFIQDQQGAIARAKRIALEEGMEKGMEKGVQQGSRDMQRSIALKLLPTLDDEAISQITGLTLEEVRLLRT